MHLTSLFLASRGGGSSFEVGFLLSMLLQSSAVWSSAQNLNENEARDSRGTSAVASGR